MPEPASTSNNRLMFSAEEWALVSRSQIERSTVPDDMDEGGWCAHRVDPRDGGSTRYRMVGPVRHFRRRAARCADRGRPDPSRISPPASAQIKLTAFCVCPYNRENAPEFCADSGSLGGQNG